MRKSSVLGKFSKKGVGGWFYKRHMVSGKQSTYWSMMPQLFKCRSIEMQKEIKKRKNGCKGVKDLIDKAPSFVCFGPYSCSDNHGPEQKSHKRWELVVEMFRGIG